MVEPVPGSPNDDLVLQKSERLHHQLRPPPNFDDLSPRRSREEDYSRRDSAELEDLNRVSHGSARGEGELFGRAHVERALINDALDSYASSGGESPDILDGLSDTSSNASSVDNEVKDRSAAADGDGRTHAWRSRDYEMTSAAGFDARKDNEQLQRQGVSDDQWQVDPEEERRRAVEARQMRIAGSRAVLDNKVQHPGSNEQHAGSVPSECFLPALGGGNLAAATASGSRQYTARGSLDSLVTPSASLQSGRHLLARSGGPLYGIGQRDEKRPAATSRSGDSRLPGMGAGLSSISVSFYRDFPHRTHNP